MDYARDLMYKYGWREGKGLGRNEDGIAQALKPKLKFDVAGVGYDQAEQFTNHWWQNVYNNAANNVKIRKKKGGVAVERAGEEVDITTSKHNVSKIKKNRNLTYGNFLQTSTLTKAGEVKNIGHAVEEPEETTPILMLPDEELFRVCGGRTVHKAARHGMKLNGKLARVEAQEQMLLKSLRLKTPDTQDERTSMCDAVEEDACIIPKKKKKKRKKSVMQDEELASCTDSGVIDHFKIRDDGASERKPEHKRHKKKSRKRDRIDESVVFEETGDTPRETVEVVFSDRKKKKSSRRHKNKDSKEDCE